MITRIVYFPSYTMIKSFMDVAKLITKIYTTQWIKMFEHIRPGVQLILILKFLTFAKKTVQEVSSRFINKVS